MSVLFKYLNPNNPDWDLIAKVETNINSDFWYHWGYFKSAELLCGDWMNKLQKQADHISIDAIIYPIYFCYRHSVEIYLKKILRTATGKPVRKTHGIKDLFDLLLGEVGDSVKQYRELSEVQKFIQILEEEDKSFTKFRYDTARDGSSHKPVDVDLVGMRDGFRMVYGFLDQVWKDRYYNDMDFQENHYKRLDPT